MSDNSNSSGGLGLGGVIFVVFLILKLTEVIDWSWWWVTSPLWIPIAFIFGVMGVIFLIAMITAMFSK